MGIRRFFWSEWGDSVHYGVDPVEPGSSNCPPDRVMSRIMRKFIFTVW